MFRSIEDRDRELRGSLLLLLTGYPSVLSISDQMHKCADVSIVVKAVAKG